MIQYKRFIFVAGLMLSVGISRADDQSAAPKAGAASAATSKDAQKAESSAMPTMKEANALAAAGKTVEAVAAYEKMGVLKSKKKEGWRLNNEGLAYLQADPEQSDKAVPVLEKAVAADETNYVAWNNLGTAYERTKQLDKAKEAYQKSIDAAKAADASSEKAEANLRALQDRLDKLAAKDESADDDKSDDAGDKVPAGGDQKK